MNPPYGPELRKSVKKAHESAEQGATVRSSQHQEVTWLGNGFSAESHAVFVRTRNIPEILMLLAHNYLKEQRRAPASRLPRPKPHVK
jgi:hypothetical protein